MAAVFPFLFSLDAGDWAIAGGCCATGLFLVIIIIVYYNAKKKMKQTKANAGAPPRGLTPAGSGMKSISEMIAEETEKMKKARESYETELNQAQAKGEKEKPAEGGKTPAELMGETKEVLKMPKGRGGGLSPPSVPSSALPPKEVPKIPEPAKPAEPIPL